MRYITYLLFALFMCSACSSEPPVEQEEIFIAAAVSLKDVFTDIGQQFETLYPVSITFNFGGSNVLQRQIESGAPADVFASAATMQMDALQEKQLILKETRASFATNRVVLIVNADSPVRIGSFQNLADHHFATIALGSPDVPVRIYGEEVLRHLNLWEQVLPKCVFGQNARQVLDYVARGEVDAGLVYGTDALIRQSVRILAEADTSWHRPITYPVAVIADSKQQDRGRQFIEYLMSESGRQTLMRYGFKE